MNKRSFIFLTIIFSIIVSILSWITWSNELYRFNVNITFLIILLICIIICFDFLFQRLMGKENIEEVRKIIVIAFIFKIFYIILFYILSKTNLIGNFAVYDDEFYYHSYLNFDYGNFSYNYYNYFLKYIYDIFGNYGVSGRIINIFIFALIAYPMAYLERNIILKSYRLSGTFLFSILPYNVFWSFFEIKDMIVMLLYILFLFICILRANKIISNVSSAFLVLAISLLTEGFRGNMGIVIIFIFIISFIKEDINIRNVFKVLIMLIFLIFFIKNIPDLLSNITNQFGKYQRWIYTQFGENSVRKNFLVTSLIDIWKLPFGIILYLMSPIVGLYDTGRFMIDFGGVLKVFEQVIVVFGILGLPKLYMRFRWIFLALILPLIFVASTNNSNYRQGIFIIPIIYLSAVLFLNSYLKNKKYKYVIFLILQVACFFMNSVLLYIKIL